MNKRIISLLLAIVLCLSTVSMLSGCKKTDNSVDALVIMTDLLDGLFNPFYYTSGNDGSIVGLTQIGMIGADYNNGEISVAYGENEAVVAKDYEIVPNDDGTVSYYFVLKNGIKFSDGHPLTMEDVLFNYYVYLDPVYTGSNTLYSTKILGLQEYRTQKKLSGDSNVNEQMAATAAKKAAARRDELADLFADLKEDSDYSEVSYDEMVAAIKDHVLSEDYLSSISNNHDEVTYENLLADYERTLELFKEELYSDYDSAQESFTDEPYDAADIDALFNDEVFNFMWYEGYVAFEWVLGADGKPDKTKIDAKSITKKYPNNVNSKEAAINYVYTDKIQTALDQILNWWATGDKLLTDYTAKAMEVLLHANIADDGSLAIENISGIVSLGHTDRAGETITINGTDYKIASGHNEDGTVKNEGEYDILEITIEGVDPKAIWNFSLTIAPQHYYGEGSKVGMDIANNKFGVEFASHDFMTKVIQSTRNVKLPMGAGVYKATDNNSSDNPTESGFYNSNMVYYKANPYFETVGEQLHNAYIEKIRYQVVSSNNAIDALANNSVHYISPSLTAANYDTLSGMKKDGFEMLTTDQLGYGYVGVNASKVNNIFLRRAIMCAMNTSLAISYYRAGTASQICWNMSKVSWAYPSGKDYEDNNKKYPQMNGWDEQRAKDNIQAYMNEAAKPENGGYSDSDLEITFTIAGSTTDHPTHEVFLDAAELLNSMGWNISVVCDSNALTKISTGSLEVWAAAWSSSLDPDMYQVYHKDSSATSVKAWGYPYIKSNGSNIELDILDDLSELIDEARETNDQKERSELYLEAMGLVLDLAVELPVYQRSVLYAYNANVLDKETLPESDEMNPYSSPLDRIWEIKFAE